MVRMFNSRSINNKINRLHERVLRIINSDFRSIFENLLEKDETVSIHVKNLQKLATEIFKISKNFSVPQMSELFHQKVNHYDLRNPYELSIPIVNTQPTQRRRKDVVRTSYFWSQRRLRLV